MTRTMHEINRAVAAAKARVAAERADAVHEDEHEPDAVNGASLPPAVADELQLTALAMLSALDYERCRETEAEKLNCRVGVLDALVAARRPKQVEDSESDPFNWAITPAPEEVNGGQLLDDLASEFEERIILPKFASTAMALWVLHTWTFETASVSPLLVFASPEMRCGKTLALGVVGRLVARAMPAANISPAALFRSVQKWQPCLVIDEADTFLSENLELRGLINSGHTRVSAYAIRSVGDDHEPHRFSTWAPKTVALIGRLHATLADRSIVIGMRRRRPDETVRPRGPDDAARSLVLRQRCARWAADNSSQLAHSAPVLPSGLDDRAADNWGHLLAIADVAGGNWPQRARSAALVLSGGDAQVASNRAMLLADIRDAFEDLSTDRILSSVLTARLGGMVHRPWPEWRGGRPLTQRQLAAQLAVFAIAPNTVRVGHERGRGYVRASFEDAFSRYLSPASVTARQAAVGLGSSPETIRDVDGAVTDANSTETGAEPGLSRGHGSDGDTDERPDADHDLPDALGFDL